MNVVLDCSVFAAAALDDESDPFAEEILKRVQTGELTAHVPSLFLYEASSVLVAACLRKRIRPERMSRYIALFNELPVQVDHDMTMPACTELAIAHNLSAYDAAYLELAKRRRCKLATLDKSLRKAAKKEGVGYRG